ncbi:3-deoxy-8-phosphooctulonate synthase [bacterium]|jgi:2-dehydro-3-deoxyphosphooctonate aldolase (KDO 8-P synthase)|nr:MAG: 3-deoxy-8-phosphooctulonate synthase [bacterium]
MPIVSKEIEIAPKVKVGGKGPFFLVAGPCVIESEERSLRLAREIGRTCADLGVPFIFKASFDKANRSSGASFRGPGLEKGLAVLRTVKEEAGVPVLSDVHETCQVEKAAEVLDVIQIPALLCRQTDLLLEVARTMKPVNIKKGQFLSPQEMRNVLDKVLSTGNDKVMLTERGTVFGYNNLVFDVRSIPIMKSWGYPVMIDASHSVQLPGGEGLSSGGEAEFIPHIARAGMAVGADGVFLEVHDNPGAALSDKHNSLNINILRELLAGLGRIREAVGPARE